MPIYSPPSFGSFLNVTSKTTTYSITNVDSVILCSGSAFTVTLPTAVGVTGKQFFIKKTDSTAANIITLNTTSSQTIGGIASGSYKLSTFGETLEIVSDGSNWQIINHISETDWTSYTLVSGTDITAVTTAPTFATSPTVKKGYWKRSGTNLLGRFEYKQPNATGAAAGSGDYLFLVPDGRLIDTSKVTASTSATSFDYQSSVGFGQALAAASLAAVNVSVYNTSRLRLAGCDVTNYINIGSSATAYPMDNAGAGYIFSYSVPITDWQP